MANKAVDLILIYQFLKRLTTPFNKTEAFKLGLIDERGKRTDKKIETTQEERAYGYFDRMVFNLKKLIEKVPGGKSRLASYAAALFLIRESEERDYTQEELYEGLIETIEFLETERGKRLSDLIESAPANVTGAAVAGTGDDPVHWKPKKGEDPKLFDARRKDVREFLRKYMEQKNKRTKLKERDEILRRMGIRK